MRMLPLQTRAVEITLGEYLVSHLFPSVLYFSSFHARRPALRLFLPPTFVFWQSSP